MGDHKITRQGEPKLYIVSYLFRYEGGVVEREMCYFSLFEHRAVTHFQSIKTHSLDTVRGNRQLRFVELELAVQPLDSEVPFGMFGCKGWDWKGTVLLSIELPAKSGKPKKPKTKTADDELASLTSQMDLGD